MFLDFGAPEEDNYNLHLLEGAATFVVMRAGSKPSRNGKEMIRMEVTVTDSSGQRGTIKTNFTVEEACKWKIKQFLLAVGDFQSINREINIEMFLKQRGRCTLELKKGEKKPDKIDEYYSDRMEIKDFIPDPKYDKSPEQDAAKERYKERRATSVKTKDNLEEPNDDLGAEWYPEGQK